MDCEPVGKLDSEWLHREIIVCWICIKEYKGGAMRDAWIKRDSVAIRPLCIIKIDIFRLSSLAREIILARKITRDQS